MCEHFIIFSVNSEESSQESKDDDDDDDEDDQAADANSSVNGQLCWFIVTHSLVHCIRSYARRRHVNYASFHGI